MYVYQLQIKLQVYIRESFDWIYSSCSYHFFVEKGTDLIYKRSNLRKSSKSFCVHA